MVHDVQASLGLLCSLSHHGMAATTSYCTLCNRPVSLVNNDAPIEEVAVFRYVAIAVGGENSCSLRLMHVCIACGYSHSTLAQWECVVHR